MALPVSSEVSSRANITAAIATLDRPEDLAVCLDAILAGDRLPGELIVVDQSARRSAQPVVERLRGAPCPIHYVHQEKRGLSASRNAAIARAACPVIAFTDDDCVPGRAWIASLERVLNTPPLPDAISGRVLPYGPETPDLYSVSPREKKTRADFTGRVIPWEVGTGGNFAIRCEWLERVGPYDERLGAGSPGKAAEDSDMIFRLLRLGARIRYEPDVLIYHQRQSFNQRMTSRWNYGFGIGAFCALWLRRREIYAGYILAHWLFNLSRELLGLALKAQRLEARQRALSLGGACQGFLYGLRVKPLDK